VTSEPPRPPFRVRFTSAAEREFRKLRADDAARLRRPILALAFDPRPPGSTKLAGSRYHRLRVGDLRVVSLIEEDAGVVVIVRVARRSESTYRRL
jgi:mRNA interferase RelE/StbE